MNKNLLIFGILFRLICVGLSGCQEQNNTSSTDEKKVWEFRIFIKANLSEHGDL